MSEIFYQEAVKPILESDFPHLAYSAALIGPGSEILGYDTPQSMDHHWGPKLQLFVKEEDEKKYRQAIKETLSHFSSMEDHTWLSAAIVLLMLLSLKLRMNQ